jgi:AraC family transcriptional regulator, regulatory protein of adaptative response / methylated-DNA-[protein]-cysteine methyltransferase
VNLATKPMTQTPAIDQTKMFQAMMARDGNFDGQFVFAVSSTGVYCRPSCPSRRPRPDRVSFFPLPEAAEQAGFRACLRCHPKSVEADPQVQMVRETCRFIEQDPDSSANLDALSKRLGISSFHLQRTFKALMGITPRQFADSCRANRFKSSVRGGESVTGAMYEAGYGSSSRLYEKANAELGMTPGTYSRAGRAMKIDYTIADSPLGYLLVASTEKGICSVKLGDEQSQLEQDFRKEFAEAEINECDSLTDLVKQIVKHLKGDQPHLDLPLDLRATAFQRRVWEALRAIPYGETRSYSEVAQEIGRPTAVRAVARACATNPVALVIPCHRVIRENRSLGGYRWGLKRKQELLAKESGGKLPF